MKPEPATTERGWWPPTVRARITAIAAITVAVVLVGASVLLVIRQRDGSIEQLDESLAVRAEQIVVQLETGAEIAPDDDDDDDDGDGHDEGILVVSGDDDDDDFVVVSDGDGARVLQGPVDARSVIDQMGGEEQATIPVGDERYRVVVEEADSEAIRVYVGSSLEDVDESTTELARSLAVIIPATVAALTIVVWILVGRTLRPVRRIREQVAAIGMNELDQRVAQPRGRDEIAELAATMNVMLGRLETSVRRQQQFVADASHELRTPLTRMRTELEVDARHPDRADPEQTRRSQLEEIEGLQRLIDDLLLLARHDAETQVTRHEQVDLGDIVRDEAQSIPADDVAIDLSRVDSATCSGDPQQLRRLVRNLIDNAARYARTRVTLEVTRRGAGCAFVVEDDGPGIPPDQRAQVLERFRRLDQSRTGAGHAGLGLAIVEQIASTHGGTITIDDAPGGGARVTITLPAS